MPVTAFIRISPTTSFWGLVKARCYRLGMWPTDPLSLGYGIESPLDLQAMPIY